MGNDVVAVFRRDERQLGLKQIIARDPEFRAERRAKAVSQALVAAGVQQAVMAVEWKGETDLAVPTADGVKEPLNRRTTIDINF